MKLISIILPEEGVAASVTDTIRFFAKANDLLKKRENEEWFKVQTVCFTREIAWNQGQLRVKADALLHESGNSHLVIVPAIDGDVIKATQLNRHYIPWLIKQYENGAGIAAFCMGNFLLAAAGLLNGRTGQTHWIYAKEFTAYYPRIKLAGENVITGGNGIYTIGGGVTYWNLLLYLLEKFTDRELTMNVAHYFSLNADSLTQSDFMLFHSQKQHGDELIQRVQHYIEQNVHEKTNIEKVAKKFCINKRTLERRFKTAVNESIGSYIQRVRIEAAKKELESGQASINEVMYQLGYSDGKTFRDLFRKITGVAPIEYKNKFARINGPR